MAVIKKKTTQTKAKKKKWFPLFAPQQFQGMSLGETYVAESTLMADKFITVNLSTLTRSMRKQNVNIHFKVDKVEDGKASTTIIGYSLINAAMKRLVRRGRDKIADSFLVKTKDKKVLRIKPILITLNKGTKSTQSAARLEARRVIREYVFAKTVEETFADIIDAKLQKLVKEACQKVYPLKTVEFRMAKLEEGKNVVLTDEVKTEKVTIKKKDRGERHAQYEEKEPASGEVTDQEQDLAEESEDVAEDTQEVEETSNSEAVDSEQETVEEDSTQVAEEQLAVEGKPKKKAAKKSEEKTEEEAA